ncbi:MAG TPA: hypothetical protein VG870_02050 [Chitinophagaceae bacterium]|nr:hypothetical protein [Chitinophagaceae bacterium]
MKSSAKKAHYFSAYPLSALNLPPQEYASELRIRSGNQFRMGSRFRLSAMVNPYPTHSAEPARQAASSQSASQDPGWHKQYE